MILMEVPGVGGPGDIRHDKQEPAPIVTINVEAITYYHKGPNHTVVGMVGGAEIRVHLTVAEFQGRLVQAANQAAAGPTKVPLLGMGRGH